jgi:hypothetical protein
VPFPVKVDELLQRRDIGAAVRDTANIPYDSSVLSIVPSATRQSFFSLFAPLAMFLFAMQLRRDDLKLTLPAVIFVGTLSGIIGVLQLAGSADGPLYLYRVTNHGSAVGLFSNRNHAAVMLACLFPILAVYATWSYSGRSGGRSIQQLIAISVAILLVPLILVTGSRAGMLTGMIGLTGGAILYGLHVSSNNRQKGGQSLTPVVAASVLLCLVFATIYFSRAEAIERFFAENLARLFPLFRMRNP